MKTLEKDETGAGISMPSREWHKDFELWGRRKGREPMSVVSAEVWGVQNTLEHYPGYASGFLGYSILWLILGSPLSLSRNSQAGKGVCPQCYVCQWGLWHLRFKAGVQDPLHSYSLKEGKGLEDTERCFWKALETWTECLQLGKEMQTYGTCHQLSLHTSA